MSVTPMEKMTDYGFCAQYDLYGHMACPGCGAATNVHRETHRGFEVPCPRCRTRLEVKLKRGEDAGAAGRASPGNGC